MADKQIHVAVLMGGLSSEREVSLRSGAACATALEGQGYRVSRLDVGRDIAARLAELRPDVCFNALHGRYGEDGCIQGVLETLGIPYTHSGVLASALAMHKERAKAVLAAAGVPVAESLVISRAEAAKRPCHAAALRDQAADRRLERRRLYRARGPGPSAPGADFAPNGRSARRSWSSAISPAGS